MNGPPPAQRLDMSDVERPGAAPSEAESTARKWIGIHFGCCGTYARVYRNAVASAYEGRCPRCARSVQVKIGPGGTRARFFRASPA